MWTLKFNCQSLSKLHSQTPSLQNLFSSGNSHVSIIQHYKFNRECETMRCEILTHTSIVLTILWRTLLLRSTPVVSLSNAGDPPDTIRLSPKSTPLQSLDLISIKCLPSHLGLTRPRSSVPRLVSVWTIILAGDIELNPGPARKWKFPCGVCAGPVKSNQKGILCEICNTWLHTRCIGMPDSVYSKLQDSTDPWACRRCLSDALPFADVSTENIPDLVLSSSDSSPAPPMQGLSL